MYLIHCAHVLYVLFQVKSRWFMMHVRKLVKSGSASHTISLPSDWVSKNNLKKGDLLYIKEKNNDIVIQLSERSHPSELKEVTLNIDDKDLTLLRRETISAYINNYQQFIFIGKSLNQRLEDIRGILNNFLALEIVEQTDTRLVAKDFLNLEEFSIPNTLRRMDMLTRSMLSDCRSKANSQSLQYRDFEIDRLFFLMSRLIRSHMQKPFSDMSNVQAMSIWWLAKNFESVGDQAKNLAEDFSKDVKPLFDKIHGYYIECSKSYFKKDKKLANELIDQRLDLLKACDKLKTPNKEKLKSIIKHSRNIAKIILDSES